MTDAAPEVTPRRAATALTVVPERGRYLLKEATERGDRLAHALEAALDLAATWETSPNFLRQADARALKDAIKRGGRG